MSEQRRATDLDGHGLLADADRGCLAAATAGVRGRQRRAYGTHKPRSAARVLASCILHEHMSVFMCRGCWQAECMLLQTNAGGGSLHAWAQHICKDQTPINTSHGHRLHSVGKRVGWCACGAGTSALGVAGGAVAALHLLQALDGAQLHAQRLHTPHGNPRFSGHNWGNAEASCACMLGTYGIRRW